MLNDSKLQEESKSIRHYQHPSYGATSHTRLDSAYALKDKDSRHVDTDTREFGQYLLSDKSQRRSGEEHNSMQVQGQCSFSQLNHRFDETKEELRPYRQRPLDHSYVRSRSSQYRSTQGASSGKNMRIEECYDYDLEHNFAGRGYVGPNERGSESQRLPEQVLSPTLHPASVGLGHTGQQLAQRPGSLGSTGFLNTKHPECINLPLQKHPELCKQSELG